MSDDRAWANLLAQFGVQLRPLITTTYGLLAEYERRCRQGSALIARHRRRRHR